MLRKIYKELVRIRKELHAIRSNMESFSKPAMSKIINAKNIKVRTNVDDYPIANHSGKINEVLHNLTNRIYRGV